MVLIVLKASNVTLKLKKQACFTNRIDYLDFVIKSGRHEVTNHRADAIRELKIPTKVIALRSYLRLCNGFRQFVPNFARITSPFSSRPKKTKQKEPRSLEENELKSLDALQETLLPPPVFTMPTGKGRFTLDTDACKRQVGCVMF